MYLVVNDNENFIECDKAGNIKEARILAKKMQSAQGKVRIYEVKEVKNEGRYKVSKGY